MKKKLIIFMSITLVIIALVLVKMLCFPQISNHVAVVPKYIIVHEKNKYLDMHLIKSGSLYGYAGAKGNIKIKPKYIAAYEFSEGLAAVYNKYDSSYIDANGEMVIKSRYYNAKDFHDGVAIVINGVKDMPSTYLYGLIDKEGKEIIPTKYTGLNDFSEGLAVVHNKNDKYGYIDKTGKEVFACKFDAATDLKNGFAYVNIDNKAYKLNKIVSYNPYPIFQTHFFIPELKQ